MLMIDEGFIKRYTEIDPPRHRYYAESVEIESELCPHSEGVYPVDLIDTARPNEPTVYKDYRKKVYEPISKTYYDKVLNLLGKIQMADDFSVKWPEPKSRFPEGDTPKDYLQEKYPDFRSIENWFFSVGLNALLDDPNSIIAVYPDSQVKADNEYPNPICHIYNSVSILDFKNKEYCVIKLDEIPDTDLDLVSGLNLTSNKSVLIVFDKNTVEKWVKIESQGREVYTPYFVYEHNTNILPCFKIGGRIREYKYGEKLYESFIQSCVPHWNESIRRYSDHQVNMALHLHPDRWEIADAECKVCRGQGTINRVVKGATISEGCGTCGGAGKVSVKTPFGVKMIRPDIKTGASDKMSIPTPPMGYAERPVETIDYLNKEWKSCIQQGLSALNMEFLMYEPAVNSGIAKTLDRGELNSFIYAVASHIVENIIQPIVYIILKQRYPLISDEEIKDMCPNIKVPVKYDIVLSNFLLEATKYAKDSGVPGNVLDQMYIEYAAKEFGKDSVAYLNVINNMALDPLPHMTADEKMTTLMNKGCTEEQYIISSQLDSFIIRAFSEDPAFGDLTLKDKRAKMSEYAKEVSDKTKTEVTPIIPEGAF